MNNKNILILGTIALIILILSYVSLGTSKVSVKAERKVLSHSDNVVLVQKTPQEKIKESLSKSSNTPNTPVKKEIPLSRKILTNTEESAVLASANQKEYGVLTIKERNSLPDDERLSKLYDLIDGWDTFDSSHQKKIEQNIRRQWKVLPKEDQSIIRDAWKSYKEQKGIKQPQQPIRTNSEIMQKLYERVGAHKRSEKILKNVQ